MKRLKIERAEDLQLVTNELQALGQLDDYTNIVRVFHYSANDRYIAMEYVDGGSLQDALDEDRGAVKSQFIELATGICEGLQAAHRERIIHSDIKPDNLLLTRAGVPKIADFGLARAMRSSRPNIGLAGTLPFMAPEVVSNQEWDLRADIYSLGVVFYFIWTGRLPFEASTAGGLLLKIAAGSYRPASELVDDIPARVARAISEMVAPLEQRVRSIDEVIQALNPPDWVKPRTIDDYQDELREIYHLQNYTRPPLVLLWHVGTSLAGVLGALTAEDRGYSEARARAYLPRLFAWTCAVISSLEWTLSEIVWFKYAGICPYCDHTPCRCGAEGRLKAPQAEVNRQLLSKIEERGRIPAPDEELSYYESLFDAIYGEINEVQGVDVVARRAQAEVFGVADALLRVKTLEDLRQVRILHLELADLVAWFFAILNMYKRRDATFDFTLNYEALFGGGVCYRCGQRPCRCPDVEDELKMFDWRRFDEE